MDLIQVTYVLLKISEKVYQWAKKEAVVYLFVVHEKPGYIALWVPSVQHPDVFWAYAVFLKLVSRWFIDAPNWLMAGVDVGIEWGEGRGEVPLFYYFTVQLHMCVGCVWKVKFPLLRFDS